MLRRQSGPRGRTLLGFREVAQRFARSEAWSLEAACGEAEDALAEARILETLAEPETRLIRFSIGEAAVDAALLDRVAAAVRGGAIQAVALRASAEGVGPALFSARLEAFCVRDPVRWTLAKRAALLGQAVQAGLHLAAAPADDLVREAAGDVAAAIRLAIGGSGADPSCLAGRRERAAMRLALRVVRDGGAALHLADPDCLDLCEALRAPPGRMQRMARALGAMS
jgi:uncharacterized protein (DUF1778 family)